MMNKKPTKKKPLPRKKAPAELKKLATEAVIESREGRVLELVPAELNPSKKGQRSESSDDGEGGSRATKAVELALAVAEPWKDPDGRAYLDIRKDGIRRTLAVSDCRSWLSGLLYAEERVALSGKAAADAVAILEAEAYLNGPTRNIYTRLAHHEGEIFLDLGDETWQAIRVFAGGWEVVKEPEVRFRRPHGMRPLMMPERKDNAWETLRSLMHDPEEKSFVLIVAWLVGCLNAGPYPILTLTGEQGTGKSTQGKVLRSFIDPSLAGLRLAPDKKEVLAVAARNSHVLAYDNLSSLDKWLSDSLCLIATGGGYSTRKHYTEGDEVIFALMNPILLTSIGSVTDRADLAERSIPVRLPVIPDTARKTEREVLAEAAKATPGILAALLDAVAVGLERFPEIRFASLPRMADFARWVAACEPALPWEEGRFLEVYENTREGIVDAGVEADPIAQAIIDLVELQPGKRWKGFTEELRVALLAVAKHSETPRGWPATPRALSARIDRALPLLRKRGIVQTLGKDVVTRKTVLVFEKVAEEEKNTSKPSDNPPTLRQSSGKKPNQDNGFGGSGGSGGSSPILAPQSKIGWLQDVGGVQDKGERGKEKGDNPPDPPNPPKTKPQSQKNPGGL